MNEKHTQDSFNQLFDFVNYEITQAEEMSKKAHNIDNDKLAERYDGMRLGISLVKGLLKMFAKETGLAIPKERR